MDNTEIKNQSWVTVTLAVFTMITSITGAYFTSKSATKSEISTIQTRKPVHIESGDISIEPPTANEFGLSSLPKNLSTTHFTPRIYTRHINFESPFEFSPLVRIGINAFDISNQSNGRIQIVAINITKTGFDLKFQTWSDTKIYFMTASWIAYEQ